MALHQPDRLFRGDLDPIAQALLVVAAIAGAFPLERGKLGQLYLNLFPVKIAIEAHTILVVVGAVGGRFLILPEADVELYCPMSDGDRPTLIL